LRPMKNTVIRFGLISGAILSVLMAILVPLSMNRVIESPYGEILGYSAMLLSYVAVYLGIRTFRDQQNGGAISFGKAFQVGILITLVTCAVYVVGWEIVYWGFIPDFGDKYAAASIERMREDGVDEATIARESREMEEFQKLYKNPFYNVGITFLEVFPLGLIVSLVSAGILRRPAGGEAARVAAA
jgi:hypothetical protein